MNNFKNTKNYSDINLISLQKYNFNKKKSIANLINKNNDLNIIINQKQNFIESITNSLSWKITSPLRYLLNISNKLIRPFKKLNLNNVNDENSFESWYKINSLITNQAKDLMQNTIKNWENNNKFPYFSIVMPTYNPNIEWFIAAIESVRNQIYPHWQLCIADDASTNPEVIEILKKYKNLDSRIDFVIRPKNGHISAASNSAIELVKGDWIALLDHDDLLTDESLYWFSHYINKYPNGKLFYSDEAKTNEKNQILDPYFKSDWNLDLFYGHNMICHLGVYKTELIKEINGFRVGYEGAQDYDLALRYIEKIKNNEIFHIPKVLYFWRIHSNSTAQSSDAKPYAEIAGEKALNGHFQRSKIQATSSSFKYGYKADYNLNHLQLKPKVDVIIRVNVNCNSELLILTISNILKNTFYTNIIFTLVSYDHNLLFNKFIIDNKNIINLKIIQKDTSLNSPELLNLLISSSIGDVLLFLDSSVYIKNSNWLEILVANAIRPDIGAVGPKILYPDDTIFSTGLVLGLHNCAASLYHHQHASYPGYMSKAQLSQSISAVSLKCLAIEKSKLLSVQGIDSKLHFEELHEINLCLSLSSLNYRTLWVPFAEVYYSDLEFSDSNKVNEDFELEIKYLIQNWENLFNNDPFYSPNLSLQFDNCRLATQSRYK